MVLKMSSSCGHTAGASLKIGLELPTGNLWICSAALAAAEACVSAAFYSKGRRVGGGVGAILSSGCLHYSIIAFLRRECKFQTLTFW